MLIGLAGCKGVGKSTAAEWLWSDYGYVNMAFADKLKDAVANLWGIDREWVDLLKDDLCWVELRTPLSAEAKTISWREFLQRFGTEMGRGTFDKDFWVDQWSHAYDAIYENDYKTKVVVTDVRFLNEAVRIHYYGGCIIEIQRPGHEPDGHASEEPLPRDIIDAVVVNDRDLGTFYQRVLATVDGLKAGIVG